MADEVNIAFGLPGTPDTNRSTWRDDPPAFLRDYALIDESYNTLVYEAEVTSKTMKVLMFGMATSLYRLMVTFLPREPNGCRVTISGQAKADVQDDLGRYLRGSTEPL
jgi:hypothetical protein